jgi:hypothetical protein
MTQLPTGQHRFAYHEPGTESCVKKACNEACTKVACTEACVKKSCFCALHVDQFVELDKMLYDRFPNRSEIDKQFSSRSETEKK